MSDDEFILVDVTDVRVLSRYVLELTFDTGETRVIDVEGREIYAEDLPLSDMGTIDGEFVWGKGKARRAAQDGARGRHGKRHRIGQQEAD